MTLSVGARASLEAIAYQHNSSLMNELVINIQQFREEAKFNTKALKNTPIEKLVMKHTGLKIDLKVDKSNAHDAYCYPPTFDHNNVIVNNWRREWLPNDRATMTKIKQAKGKLGGVVDFANSRVSGAFSEIECEVAVSVGLWKDEHFTDKEIAAIIGHELGHLFTFFAYLYETVTTNQILYSTANQVLQESDIEKRLVILAACEKDLDISLLDRKALAESNSATVISQVLISTRIRQSRSGSDSYVYDHVSWEAVADQFVTRHGGGRDIVTSLAKLHRQGGDPIYLPAMLRWAHQVLTISGMALISYASIVAGSVIVPIIVGLMLLGSAIEDLPTYDTLPVRLKRVRGQVTGALKNRDLSQEHKERYLEDLKVIDFEINQLNEGRDVLEFVWDSLLPGRRKSLGTLRMQQQLEELANNSFFKQGAIFSSMSGNK